MKKDNKSWMIVSIGALVLSVVSLFLPIIIAQNERIRIGYNLFALLDGSFLDDVMSQYRGSFMQNVDFTTSLILLILLSVIGVAAIVLAFIGIRSMSKQFESAWPFRLAITGLIGTAIPSLAMIIFYGVAKTGFSFEVRLGLYAYITPIAMVLACFVVANRHRLTQEERLLHQQSEQYIRPAGDLPVGKQGGRDNGGQQ